MLSLASASCLITDHRQFEVVDYPPSIVPSVSATILPNQVKKFSVDDFGTGDGGIGELQIDVVVRDPNVDQRLHFREVINELASNPLPRIFEPMDQPMPNGEVARPYTAHIPMSELNIPGCNKIEFWVSSDFSGARSPQPSNPNDIAVLVYWIAITDSAGSPVDMTRCR